MRRVLATRQGRAAEMGRRGNPRLWNTGETATGATREAGVSPGWMSGRAAQDGGWLLAMCYVGKVMMIIKIQTRCFAMLGVCLDSWADAIGGRDSATETLKS